MYAFPNRQPLPIWLLLPLVKTPYSCRYSLNPGRYVGVVIEEDGKTEEEFIESLSALQTELQTLNDEAQTLSTVISHNVQELTGDE
jgi:hypothetical protein